MNEIVKVPGEMNWGYDFAAQITDVFFPTHRQVCPTAAAEVVAFKVILLPN